MQSCFGVYACMLDRVGVVKDEAAQKFDIEGRWDSYSKQGTSYRKVHFTSVEKSEHLF